MSVDLESLSDVLKHPIRRRIIFVLYESGRLSYVDLMNLVEVDSTGKFNYHLKILGDLIEKGRNGKYGLTEKGRMIAQLLQKFPEKKVEGKDKLLKIGYNLSISAGMLIIVTEIVRLIIFQFYNPSCICFPEPLSRVNLRAGNQILALTAFIFGPIQIICGILTKRKLYIILPLTFLSSLPLVFLWLFAGANNRLLDYRHIHRLVDTLYNRNSHSDSIYGTISGRWDWRPNNNLVGIGKTKPI